MSDQVIHKRIRTRKEHSAFVYAILEAHEGIASYSTLPCPPGAPFRDVQLVIPVALAADVDQVLRDLSEVILKEGSESDGTQDD